MFKIAVTGHRSNRLCETTESSLIRSVERLLIRLQNQSGESTLIISALAEGADRIAVEASLRIGAPFRVILPFAPEVYKNDFDSDTSKQRFSELINLAQSVEIVESSNHQHSEGYVRVGDALLAEADALLAIWDGRPPRGRGGTADVVSKALNKRIPVIWLLPQVETSVRLITKDIQSQQSVISEHWLESLLALISED